MASFLGGFFIYYYVFRQSVWSIYNELRDRSNKAQVSSLPLGPIGHQNQPCKQRPTTMTPLTVSFIIKQLHFSGTPAYNV